MNTKETTAYAARWLSCSRLALFAAVLLTGCGILGDQDEGPDDYSFAKDKTGCFNELGPRVTRYLDGAIEAAEWSGTFDCAVDNLELFKKYIQGDGPDGAYSKDDLFALATKVLVTDRPVSRELIDTQFEMKASLLGGSAEHFSHADIDRIIENIRLIRDESTKLIPLVRAVNRDPSAEQLQEFSDALDAAWGRFADFIGPGGSQPLTSARLDTMFHEFSNTFGWKFPERLADRFFAIRNILASGGIAEVKASEWANVLRAAGKFGGPGLAFWFAKSSKLKDRLADGKAGPNAYGEFLLQVAYRLKRALDWSLSQQNGELAMEKLFHLMDVVPADWLPAKAPTLRSVAGVVAHRLFESRSPEVFDGKSFERALGLLEKWVKGKTHLERIFEEGKLDPAGVSLQELADAAQDYASAQTEAELPAILRLVTLAKKYRPMFNGNDELITLAPLSRYSRSHLEKMHWMHLASDWVVEHYSKLSVQGTDAGGYAAVDIEGIRQFVSDFNDLGVDLEMLDYTVTDWGDRRLRDADIFLLSANGDGKVNADELTVMVAYLSSIGSMTKKVREELEELCRIGDEKDPLGWHWMDPACFRKEYFQRYRTFWANAPYMLRYYEQLSPGDQKKISEAMEAGGRRFGISAKPVGSFDVSSMIGGVHYIEALFLRWDANGDQKLNLGEGLSAFKVFKETIAKVAGSGNSNSLLEAAFTYILKYGRPPKDNIWGKLHFLWWWKIYKPWWKLDTQRMIIYGMMPLFKTPEGRP